MQAIRRLVAAMLFAAASFVPAAWATSFSTDQSDVWSVPGENGWGFIAAQRGSVMFGAIFVYDPNKVPIWYSATLVYAGNSVWKGDLYRTTGPWFGKNPYQEVSVSYRKVGSLTWTSTSSTDAMLKYDVDGVLVVKSPTRLLLVNDDFSGHFAGGIHQTVGGCANPAFNSDAVERVGILDIAQNGQAIALSGVPASAGSCTYNGTLAQAGQMGAVSGSYACSNGDAGAFQIFEMQVNPIGVSGRFSALSATLAGCQLDGWFGGMRVTTF